MDDVLRLRQQKAEEAVRQKAEEERMATHTKAIAASQAEGSLSALQKMSSFARRSSRELQAEDNEAERQRLAKMLRSYLDERQSHYNPEERRASERRASARRASQRRASQEAGWTMK